MSYTFNPLIFSGFDLTGAGSTSGYRAPVASQANLPLVGNSLGDARVTLDTNTLWLWNGTAWEEQASVNEAQTLTNKTIDGDNNTIQDVGLGSLKVDLVNADNFLVRDGSGAVVSNTKAVPTGVVVGSSDSQTLTNKTIDGDDNTVQDLALSTLKTSLPEANNFLSRDASGIVVSTVDVPTGAVVGISDVQTLTNKTIDADANTITNIENADIKVGAAIDAAKIADGSISNAEFEALNSVSSNIQTQLNGKQPTGNYITSLTGDVSASGPGAATATISGLDATKIADGSVTNTEFQYINSLTSNAQDQLDAKASTTYVNTTFIPLTEKGAALGVATLDGGGKVPVSQLPNSIMDYLGQWAASTNTPTLADGSGNPGDVYQASDAGTVDFGSGNITFAAGDWVIYSGTVWQKSLNSNAVASVNGFTGIVSLDTDDVNEGATNLYFNDERAQDAVGTILTDSAQIDFTYNDATPSITALIVAGSVANAEIATGAAIDATKLADGSITNTELQYINALTSDAQTQFNNKQPLDSTLTALAAYNTNGLLTQTSADTFTGRTVVAGSSKVSISNGDGVAGNPSIDVVEANLNIQNMAGTLAISQGGTGQTAKAAAFDALSPMTTLGDLIYGGAGGTGTRLPLGVNSQVLSLSSGLPVWTSPASSGGKNYLDVVNGTNLNGNFELGTTAGWSLGITGALTNSLPTTTPTFGSGASGNLSISTVSSGQIAGSYSLSYSSSAATTVGNALASNAFSIDIEDQAKPMTVKFSYKAQTNPSNANWSGTSANSFAWAIWDVTNSVWIIPTGAFGMTQSSGVGYCIGTFQTSSNSTQYRLVVYNANATSGSITVYFDDFFLGPQTASLGAVIADLGTETWTDSWANTTTSVRLTRIGGKIFVEGRATLTGVPTSTNFNVTISAAYTAIAAAVNGSPGTATMIDTGSNNYPAFVQLSSANSLNIYSSSASGASTAGQNSSTTVPFTWASGDFIEFSMQWDVAAWSSNVQMSNDTDTRVVATVVSGTSTTITNTGNDLILTTIVKDTHGGWSSSIYTVPVTGFYQIQANMLGGSVAQVAGNTVAVGYKVNGGGATYLGFTRISGAGTASYMAQGSATIFLNAGDTLRFWAAADVTQTPISLTASIFRLSGPSTIAATETVAFYGNTTATTSFTSTSITLGFTTVLDTHSSFVTNTFTVPVAGVYDINAVVPIYHQTAGSNAFIRILVNGGIVSSCYQTGATAGQGLTGVTNYQARLKPGDTITVQANNTSGGTITLMGATVGTVATLKITRMGI